MADLANEPPIVPHQTATLPSRDSHAKKRKAPYGNMEISGITVETKIREFVHAHIRICDRNFLATHVIHAAFLAESNTPDLSTISDCTFQKILKKFILDQFSIQSRVSYCRSRCNGERAWGYTGISLSHQYAAPVKGIYVLQLDNKQPPSYYVGKSNDINQRIQQHTDGTGASCVAGEAFTSVEPLTKGSVDDMESWERNEVLTRMFEFGIDNVRGWMYTFKVMPIQQKVSAFDQICEKFDRCRKCGRGTHFVRDCQAMSADLWSCGMELRPAYNVMSTDQQMELDAAVEERSRAETALAAAELRIAEAARVLGGYRH